MYKKPDYTGRKFLVVDDSDLNLQILTHLLKTTGAGILTAANGELALKVLSEEQPDLIFLDLHMPVMNGAETAAEIRKTNREIPILALTADTSAEAQLSLMDAGMNGMLSKPFDKVQIYSVLQQYLPLY